MDNLNIYIVINKLINLLLKELINKELIILLLLKCLLKGEENIKIILMLKWAKKNYHLRKDPSLD
jgi:hypothetical protein